MKKMVIGLLVTMAMLLTLANTGWAAQEVNIGAPTAFMLSSVSDKLLTLGAVYVPPGPPPGGDGGIYYQGDADNSILCKGNVAVSLKAQAVIEWTQGIPGAHPIKLDIEDYDTTFQNLISSAGVPQTQKTLKSFAGMVNDTHNYKLYAEVAPADCASVSGEYYTVIQYTVTNP